MSIHFWKSYDVAKSKGAWFGALTAEQVSVLNGMSKRELIEIALHLAALKGGEEDVDVAFENLVDEARILKNNGLV